MRNQLLLFMSWNYVAFWSFNWFYFPFVQIISWISQIIEDGDTRDLPDFVSCCVTLHSEYFESIISDSHVGARCWRCICLYKWPTHIIRLLFMIPKLLMLLISLMTDMLEFLSECRGFTDWIIWIAVDHIRNPWP